MIRCVDGLRIVRTPISAIALTKTAGEDWCVELEEVLVFFDLLFDLLDFGVVLVDFFVVVVVFLVVFFFVVL